MSVASRIVFLAVLLAGPGVGEGRVEGRGAARRFVSENYRFSMAVPVGWGVSIGLDTPVFFYAPSSARFIQDNIPQGGAVITTEPHDAVSRESRPTTTPEEWALADTRASVSNRSPIESFLMPRASGVSRAVTCSYDEPTFSPDQRTQHSVAIFWEFEKKLFAAHLNYNRGDPRGPAFEKVFLRTIRSLRPLAEH
jgi:hypothetical protein